MNLCNQPSRLTLIMGRLYLTVGRPFFGVNMGKYWTMSEEGREKIRQSKMGKKNPQYGLREEKNQHWKGDNVGYHGVHDWLTRQYGQPKKCESCLLDDENARYEWANTSGKYKRDRKDFMRLCKKCHNDYDGVNAWQNWKRAKGYKL